MREKEQLLDLLEEEEIRAKIKEIVSEENKGKVKQEFRTLTFRNTYSESEMRSKIKSVREEYEKEYEQKAQELHDTYKGQIIVLNEKLEETEKRKIEAQEETERVKAKYSEMEYLYYCYQRFEPYQMRWFDKVLHAENQKAESPLALVVWATQKENLTSMWEIISLHINELERSSTTKLFAEFFEICFCLYAATTRGKAVINKPRVGESYEPLKHSKTVDSRVAGVIEEVVLPGYKIGNETSKAIVKVQ